MSEGFSYRGIGYVLVDGIEQAVNEKVDQALELFHPSFLKPLEPVSISRHVYSPWVRGLGRVLNKNGDSKSRRRCSTTTDSHTLIQASAI